MAKLSNLKNVNILCNQLKATEEKGQSYLHECDLEQNTEKSQSLRDMSK